MDKIFLAVELQVGDAIGFTFFLTSIAMLAATVFFFIERGSVAEKWKLSLTVSGLITGIAAVHYYYMRTVWIETGMSPTEFRYIDWILTVPLMCEAGLLPVANIGPAFWGLLSGLAYLFIVNEVYRGEIALAAAKASKKIANANSLLLKFIIIGWGIYPLGYLIGTGDGQWYSVINGIIDTDARELIYNIGDAANKIGFGLVIWSVAKK